MSIADKVYDILSKQIESITHRHNALRYSLGRTQNAREALGYYVDQKVDAISIEFDNLELYTCVLHYNSVNYLVIRIGYRNSMFGLLYLNINESFIVSEILNDFVNNAKNFITPKYVDFSYDIARAILEELQI